MAQIITSFSSYVFYICLEYFAFGRMDSDSTRSSAVKCVLALWNGNARILKWKPSYYIWANVILNKSLPDLVEFIQQQSLLSYLVLLNELWWPGSSSSTKPSVPFILFNPINYYSLQNGIAVQKQDFFLLHQDRNQVTLIYTALALI